MRAWLQRWLDRLAAVVLLIPVLAAPWLFGGVKVWHQFPLSAGAAAGCTIWALGRFIGPAGSRERLPGGCSTVLAVLLCLIAAAQLLPLVDSSRITTAWARTVEDVDPGAAAKERSPASTIAPSVTRVKVATLAVVAGVFLVSADLFRRPEFRMWLFGALAVNGVGLTVLGIAQRLTWNEKLYWVVPLRYGGTPFASFVNRNSAAGYLLICLGAGLAAMIASRRYSAGRTIASGTIVFGVLCAMIGMGVGASYSRMGFVAGGAACLAVTPILVRTYGRAAAAPMVLAGIGLVGVLSWLGLKEGLEARLETLHEPTQELQFRLNHWCDAMDGLRDRPWLGSGMGTYRYASRPYQLRATHGWFQTADSLYVEFLVEAGLVGGVVGLLFLASLVRDVWALRPRGRHWDHRDLYVGGLFVLVALGVHGGTDSGLILLSLELGAAVMLGAVAGAAAARRGVQGRDRRGDNAPARIGLVGRVLVPTALTAAVAGAVLAVVPAARADVFIDRLPPRLTRPNAMPPGDLSTAIDAGERLADESPDDARLQYAVASLLIYRYRQEIFDELKAAAPKSREFAVWDAASLEELYKAACVTPDEASVAALTGMPVVSRNLPAAARLLDRARLACNWLPGLDYDVALLSFLNTPSDPRGLGSLGRNAILSPAETKRLLMTAKAAMEGHGDDLASLCWRKSLELRPESLKRIVSEARRGFDDVQIAESILERPTDLVAFAAMTSQSDAKSVVADRLGKLVADMPRNGSDGMFWWISAQRSLIQGDTAAAVEALTQAVSQAPLQVDWRLELANALVQLERLDEAREQLSTAARLAPARRDIQSRLKEIIEARLRRPSTPKTTPRGAE